MGMTLASGSMVWRGEQIAYNKNARPRFANKEVNSRQSDHNSVTVCSFTYAGLVGELVLKRGHVSEAFCCGKYSILSVF